MTNLVRLTEEDMVGLPVTLADGSRFIVPAFTLVNSAGDIAGQQVEGTVAHDAVDSGNPVKMGFYGSLNARAGSVTDGDRVDAWGGSKGQLYVTLTSQSGGSFGDLGGAGDGDALAGALATRGFNMAFNGTTWDRMRGDTNGMVFQSALGSSRWAYPGVTGGLTTTADTIVMAAGGAGVRNFVHGLQYSNSSATASEIVIKDNATVIWRGMAPASMTGQICVTFDPPLRGTANTALNVAMITTGTATRISLQGHQGA